MIDEAEPGRKMDWRRGGLIGAFAGVIAAGVWALMASAVLGALGCAEALRPEPVHDLALWDPWVYCLSWILLASVLAIHFAIVALPLGAVMGGLGGLVWRGRPGRVPDLAGGAVGALLGAGLWFVGVEPIAGRENIPWGSMPGMVAGIMAGWLFVQLARRAAAPSPAGYAALTTPRRVLFSQAAICLGGASGILTFFALWDLLGDLGGVLWACALAAIPCLVSAALFGTLRQRPLSPPRRGLLAVCGLSAVLLWLLFRWQPASSDDPSLVIGLLPVYATPIVMVAVGLCVAWWTLARLQRSGHGTARLREMDDALAVRPEVS